MCVYVYGIITIVKKWERENMVEGVVRVCDK